MRTRRRGRRLGTDTTEAATSIRGGSRLLNRSGWRELEDPDGVGGGSLGFGGVEEVPTGAGDEGGQFVHERDQGKIGEVGQAGGEDLDGGDRLGGGVEGEAEHALRDDTVLDGDEAVGEGDEAVPASTLTVSVAPISIDSRGAIIDTLIAQGLNEAVVDDGISYAQIGDENSAPAVLNIIRDDSWISVIQATGGEKYFDLAVELAGEAAAQVYVAE